MNRVTPWDLLSPEQLNYWANAGTPGGSSVQPAPPPPAPIASAAPAGGLASQPSAPLPPPPPAADYYSTSAPPPAAGGLPPSLQAALEGSLGKPPAQSPNAPLPDYAGGPILGITGAAPPAQARAQFAQQQQTKKADAAAGATAPTPEEDAAFAKHVSSGGGDSAPNAGRGGGGGGGDFGVGAARKDFYGTFGAEQGAMQRLATAERAKSEALAAGEAVIGADRVAESNAREEQAKHEAEIMQGYQDETQRQLDDVRSQRVDPNRLYRDTGSGIIAIIGGVLGGLYQGLNKLDKNPFIEQMNANINRDIALQENALARADKAIDSRRSLLKDMRQTYGDEALAKAQAKNLYYEGIKQQLAAEAATYDSPAIQARADQAINAVGRQQAALKLDEAAKKAAASAAQAAWARAEMWKEREYNLKLYGADTDRIKAEKEGGKHPPGQSPEERFVGVKKLPDGTVEGYLARKDTAAEKQELQRAARAELAAEIDHALKIRDEAGGMLGRTLNRQNPDNTIQLYTPEWQTKIRAAQAALTRITNKAAGLGAYDEGTKQLLAQEIGSLESRGEQSDVRLREIRDRMMRANDADENAASGQRAVRLPDGRVVPSGGVNGPVAPRQNSPAQREP
jgi:hypothetical protein